MLFRKGFICLVGILCLAGCETMEDDAWVAGPCDPPPPPRERIVFVTPHDTDGDIGGLAGADSACQYYAQMICGLTGTFKAWLSDRNESPSTRFTKDGMFKLVDGTTVADSWSDLTDRDLDHPIDLDCTGAYHDWVNVWTATDQDGSSIFPDEPWYYSCYNWTDDQFGSGVAGTTGSAEWAWTEYFIGMCPDRRHLYCFQQ